MGDVQRYTLADVASRNGKNAPVWIIYKDSVYDVTTYVDEHPDGPDSIMEQAGKDATKDFDQTGHTADAKTIMTKYKIGEIIEEEKKYDANGKKKKKVVSAPPEKNNRSCINIVTCGLIG
ncbi:cytochrome b5-like [Bombyx mandarina]|uniref:Cytochrome b5 heme-binding domain-containing protein n=2 Tax=Bombyx TaxID=7090 RepID=A0A8R1WHM9_BOMMO|nr:cytochrome b5 [Bombyx mori]XP_028035592.1 cytochrome b5-like [Bombyx mandarina]XP_037871222.1 cytochrome b5 [Bombyx mori]